MSGGTSKIVYDGEWVSVANYLNKRFPKASKPCSRCRRATCAPVWYSIKSNDVRCKKCFTPKGAA